MGKYTGQVQRKEFGYNIAQPLDEYIFNKHLAVGLVIADDGTGGRLVVVHPQGDIRAIKSGLQGIIRFMRGDDDVLADERPESRAEGLQGSLSSYSTEVHTPFKDTGYINLTPDATRKWAEIFVSLDARNSLFSSPHGLTLDPQGKPSDAGTHAIDPEDLESLRAEARFGGREIH